jgi:hypothetical protein
MKVSAVEMFAAVLAWCAVRSSVNADAATSRSASAANTAAYPVDAASAAADTGPAARAICWPRAITPLL